MKREDIASSIRCVHRRYLVTRVWAPNWVMAWLWHSRHFTSLRVKVNCAWKASLWGWGVGGSAGRGRGAGRAATGQSAEAPWTERARRGTRRGAARLGSNVETLG